MGCFSTCFNTCKPSRRRRRRRSLKTHPSLLEQLEKYQSIDDFKIPQLIQEEEEEEEIEENGREEQVGEEKGDNAIDLSPDTKSDEKKEKVENLSGRKKVTFDLNVKFYDNLKQEEETETEEINEEEMVNEYSDDDDDVDETGKKEVKGKPSSGFECECASDSSSSSLFSYPLNHRYQNIRDSDDEFDDMVSSDESDIDDYTDSDHNDNDNDTDSDDGGDGDGDGDGDGGGNDGVNAEEQSSESLFSLSIDSRKKKLGTFGSDKEVNSPIPTKNALSNDSNSRYDRTKNVDSVLNPMNMNNAPSNDLNSGYDHTKIVDSVLNPVENLTQWKDIKSRSRRVSKNQPNQNQNSVQDFSFPDKKEAFQTQKEIIAVDTSLSTWLVGSEQGTPKRSNSRNSSVSVGNSQADSKKVSPNKFEDRPILGALTLEEIRQMSAGNTPRKSRSQSPVDKPIIGSVGSYWSHTGQATDSGGSTKSTKSRYRESAEIIWDATPFETRLEKALEKEANAEQVFAV